MKRSHIEGQNYNSKMLHFSCYLTTDMIKRSLDLLDNCFNILDQLSVILNFYNPIYKLICLKNDRRI